jgi:hypothetical protein
VTKKFYDIDWCGQCYRTFFFITHNEANQTRAFVTGKLFQPGLIFVGKARSLPYGRARLERLVRDKCSSLTASMTKKLYKIDCWGHCYKLISSSLTMRLNKLEHLTVANLFIRLERLTRNKCSSLTSSREKFYNIDCWVNVIKLLFISTHNEAKQARAFGIDKIFSACSLYHKYLTIIIYYRNSDVLDYTTTILSNLALARSVNYGTLQTEA